MIDSASLYPAGMWVALYRLAWFVAPVLDCVILAFMLARRRVSAYPAFFGYIALDAARASVLLPLMLLFAADYQRYYPIYFWFYWGSEAVADAVALLLIYTTTRAILEVHSDLRRRHALLFCLFLIVSLLISIGITAIETRAGSGFMEAIVVGQRTVMVIQSAVLLCFVLLSSTLALPWSSANLGIVLGLGVWSTLDGVTYTIRAAFGTSSNFAVNLMFLFNGITAVIIWLVYFAKREQPVPAGHLAPSSRMADQLDASTSAVTAVFSGK